MLGSASAELRGDAHQIELRTDDEQRSERVPTRMGGHLLAANQ
jgi:hypothetical protein